MGEKKSSFELYPNYTELAEVIAQWFEKGTKEQKDLANKYLLNMSKICDHVMSVALGKDDTKTKNKNFEEAIKLMTK